MKTFALSPGDQEHARPDVAGFFDPRTFSIQYVVSYPATRRCVIIDPVLDYDEKAGATATLQADRLLEYIEHEGLQAGLILDTHLPASAIASCPANTVSANQPFAVVGIVIMSMTDHTLGTTCLPR